MNTIDRAFLSDLNHRRSTSGMLLLKPHEAEHLLRVATGYLNGIERAEILAAQRGDQDLLNLLRSSRHLVQDGRGTDR